MELTPRDLVLILQSLEGAPIQGYENRANANALMDKLKAALDVANKPPEPDPKPVK